ncbi:MAG: hypothetical protein KatS3mg110_0146 [Pirellulaceae bacterium]|nr:MAG: hypothetical protein KatS3mg110_0146 [Pirellulaceae bacterium]
MGTRTSQSPEPDFVAFDCETTGLQAGRDHIVELAAVRFSGTTGEITGRQSWLVCPPVPIPLAATRVHGLTDRHVAGKPTIREVLPEFIRFVGERPCVMLAHNAIFDLSFLAAAGGGSIRSVGHHPVVDTYKLARKLLPGRRAYTLHDLARSMRILQPQSHRALEDCELLREVFLRLLRTGLKKGSLPQLLSDGLVCYFDDAIRSVVAPNDCLKLLRDAIRRGTSLDVLYFGGAQPGASRKIRPLELQGDGPVYVVAFCFSCQANRTFRLDRLWVLNGSSRRPLERRVER